MGEDGRPKLEYTPHGQVVFKGNEKFPTLEKSLGNKDMFAQLSGATGGNQGRGGTMAGRPYEPGGFWNTVVEGFAGTHDFIGGQLPGFYDSEGNASRGRAPVTDVAADVWAGAAIPLAAPFAVSEIVSPELLEFIFAAGK